jgi:putative transposase
LELYPEHYYHFYNRSNNQEYLFRTNENYLYFLEGFRKRLTPFLDTIAYCLMPTHFHWLVYINIDDIFLLQRKIGDWLSGYTRALNKQVYRNGSLFQQHSKARLIRNDRDLLTVATYIHQNPVRAGLVGNLEEWPYSSYRDYAGLRNGSLPKKEMLFHWFPTIEEFRTFSEELLESIDLKYWV